MRNEKPLMRKRTLTDIRSETGFERLWLSVQEKEPGSVRTAEVIRSEKYSAVRTAEVIRSDKKINHTAVRLLLQFVYKNHSTVQMAKGIRFSNGWYYPFRMNFIQLSDWLYIFTRSKQTFSLSNDYFCPYSRKNI